MYTWIFYIYEDGIAFYCQWDGHVTVRHVLTISATLGMVMGWLKKWVPWKIARMKFQSRTHGFRVHVRFVRAENGLPRSAWLMNLRHLTPSEGSWPSTARCLGERGKDPFWAFHWTGGKQAGERCYNTKICDHWTQEPGTAAAPAIAAVVGARRPLRLNHRVLLLNRHILAYIKGRNEKWKHKFIWSCLRFSLATRYHHCSMSAPREIDKKEDQGTRVRCQDMD
jgi:hypothetical protein